MGIPFHETIMGHRFYESQLPSLIKTIGQLAAAQAENTKQVASLTNAISLATSQKDALSPFAGQGFSAEISEETKQRLYGVVLDSEKAEALGDAFLNAVSSDDESPCKLGYFLAKAVIAGNINDLLTAVCGWNIEALLNQAENPAGE